MPGIDRRGGTTSSGASGIPGVAVVLENNHGFPMTITNDGNDNFIAFDSATNPVYPWDSYSSIPAGLGLSYDITGTPRDNDNRAVTYTETGIWQLTFGIRARKDATGFASLVLSPADYNAGIETMWTRLNWGASATTCGIENNYTVFGGPDLPGINLIVRLTDATASPYTIPACYLQIVRLK